VVVGDVDPDEALKRIDHHFGAIAPGSELPRLRTAEPEQTGERRLTIRKEGTTAYLKVAHHAPGVSDPGFVPLLVLDAVLTGAKGLNLWSSFRVPPPQRRARLYRALVERRLASAVNGILLPTAEPFLYTFSVTANEGTPLAAVEAALVEELDRVSREGITGEELTKARAQLKARLVFDNDSVTNIAHQLGYFETVGGADVFLEIQPRIAAVTSEEVFRAAANVLKPSNRTIGWFEPLPPASEVGRSKGEV
jgi:zinc protease